MSSVMISFLRLFFGAILYWVLAFLLFMAIRYNGLEQEMIFYSDETFIFPTDAFYEVAIVLGITTGVLYAVIEIVAEKVTNHLALGLTILLKSSLYFILMVFLLSKSFLLIEQQGDIDLPNEGNWWQTNGFFWNAIIFFIVASTVFQLIRIAIDRFGQGNFLSILIGKYKRPKEEEHVLMFLDLKDSTAIAEKLGHLNYSKFIQDCFTDLDRVLNKYDAKVYQYVGDEAVVFWNIKNGFKNNNCILLFNAFEKKLAKKKKYYQKKYDFEPIFKAGIHFGKLTVVEVGNTKKELAFHGDVINTASRIQNLCNGFNRNLLVSESVLNKLNISESHYELMSEDIELRGKEERLKIYAI
ncbi:adenylate/guanylate cyclase domain-containing protein [Winogradskyella litorisediminis]|uniref:Adenylate/guanylate cyclase domain-containing protein n=1 Tax=Winogradskyella litorisediminis TaxID=1156618 RepID=A0ABW3N7H1_9FLAO